MPFSYHEWKAVMQCLRRAAFLDRDGVLVKSLVIEGRPVAARCFEEFEILPTSSDAVARLRKEGFLVIVVTNQPDVGRGLVAKAEVDRMNQRLRNELYVDDVFVCFHVGHEGCECRKPKPGMLLEAARRWQIDLGASFMVGDRASDIEAGRAAGCRTVWIESRYAELRPESSDLVAPDIGAAARAIISAVRKSVPEP